MAHPMQIITPDNAFSDLTAGTTVVVSDDAIILGPEDARLALLGLRYLLDVDEYDRRITEDVKRRISSVVDALVEQVGP